MVTYGLLPELVPASTNEQAGFSGPFAIIYCGAPPQLPANGTVGPAVVSRTSIHVVGQNSGK